MYHGYSPNNISVVHLWIFTLWTAENTRNSSTTTCHRRYVEPRLCIITTAKCPPQQSRTQQQLPLWLLTIVLQQLLLELWQCQSVLWRAGTVVIETHLVQLKKKTAQMFQLAFAQGMRSEDIHSIWSRVKIWPTNKLQLTMAGSPTKTSKAVAAETHRGLNDPSASEYAIKLDYWDSEHQQGDKHNYNLLIFWPVLNIPLYSLCLTGADQHLSSIWSCKNHLLKKVTSSCQLTPTFEPERKMPKAFLL